MKNFNFWFIWTGFKITKKFIKRNIIVSCIQYYLTRTSSFRIEKINYCLKALANIGFIKIHNFNNSYKKLNYAYILTLGIKEKTAIMKQFIIKKKQEYDKLNSYIN